jgi:hypothetical protein
MDSVVLSWILETITIKLKVVRERGSTARQAWVAIEEQFLRNHDAHVVHLDDAFRIFVQENLSVTKY